MRTCTTNAPNRRRIHEAAIIGTRQVIKIYQIYSPALLQASYKVFEGVVEVLEMVGEALEDIVKILE